MNWLIFHDQIQRGMPFVNVIYREVVILYMRRLYLGRHMPVNRQEMSDLSRVRHHS